MPTSPLRDARVACSVVFFTNGSLFASWASRVPAIKSELHASPGALGLALFGLAGGALAGMALGGFLVSRWPSRPLTLAGLLGYCPALLLLALAPDIVTLGVGLAVMGTTASVVDIAMNVHGVRIERGYGRPILSGFHGFFSLGGFAGAAAGAVAAAAGLSPLAHFSLAAAANAALGLAAVRWFLRGPDGGERDSHLARPSGDVTLLAVLALCCLLAEGTVNDWSAVYLRDVTHAGPGLAAAGFAVFSLTMTGGRLMADRMVARIGRIPFLRGAGLVAVTGQLLVVSAVGPVMAVTGFAVLGAGLAGMVPTVFGTAALSRGLGPAVAIAAVSTFGYTGFMAGPPVIGGIAELLGLRAGLGLVLLLLVLFTLLTRRACAPLLTDQLARDARDQSCAPPPSSG